MTEQLPATMALTPPTPLLQETEKVLIAATKEAFEAVEKHAEATIAKYDQVVWENLNTGKGLDAAKEARRELRECRTRIVDELHSAIKAPLLAVGTLADTKKKEIGQRLKAAEDKIDTVIKAEEDRKAAEKEAREKAERERLQAIRERINAIHSAVTQMVGKSAADIRGKLQQMTSQNDTPDAFQEFLDEANAAYAQAVHSLKNMLTAAEAQEAEQQRLAQERQRLADEARRQQEEAQQRQAELDAQAAELRRQQDELAAKQAQAAAPAVIEQAPAEEAAPALSPVATAEPAKQEPAADRTTIPNRPSNEELVMLVAHHCNVAEDIAFGWLMEFPTHAEKKVA